MIKEFTSGTFGKWLWYRYCFWISFDKEKVIVRTPFKKRIIPVKMIEKLLSTKLPFVNGLVLINHALNISPQITFISVNPRGWFEAFEQVGIQTEDPQNLRTASTGWVKFFKYLNLFAGFLGLMVALAALVLVLIVLLFHVRAY